MQIDPNTLHATQNSVQSTTPDRSAQRAAEGQRLEKLYGSRTEDSGRSQEASDSDRVQLSNLSAEVAALAQADSPGRASRTERLAQLVQSGRYQLDSRAVGRAMIADSMAG